MDYIQSLLGGKPAQAPIRAQDSDFADFAGAPAPSPVSIPASPADAQQALPTGPYGNGPVVYTKWYRVWERTALEDFKVEMILMPFIVLALLVHYWGTRRNRSRAKKWAAVHAPLLDSEFALVGFSGIPKITPYSQGVQNAGLLEAAAKLPGDNVNEDLLKEKTAFEFETYASGRLNIAFMDLKLVLYKWYNPLTMIAEQVTGLFFESIKPQPERMEAVIYTFDGNEKNFVAPPIPGSEEIEKSKPVPSSNYDQFIFAIVNKMAMRRLRDERYDLSLTSTKDHARLPQWATTMSESAEVTEALLTKELVAAIEQVGETFQYLIVTDQSADKPTTLDEATPKKRLNLCLRLPSDGNWLNHLKMFQAFIRIPDFLVTSGRFRPEVMKKINSVREAEKGKLKKVSDQAAEEERQKLADKLRKEERDRKMKGMSAEEQRKFLEKESAKDRKKQEKRMTRKG